MCASKTQYSTTELTLISLKMGGFVHVVINFSEQLQVQGIFSKTEKSLKKNEVF